MTAEAVEQPLNDSLENLIELLGAEVERLKVDLETFRLTESPNRDRVIAELIRAIDLRQDRLIELQALQQAVRSDPQIH